MADPTVSDLHALLLGFAGRAPDGWLAIVRARLAEGDGERVSSLLSVLVSGGTFAVTGAEATTLAGLLADPAILDKAPRMADPPALTHRFDGTGPRTSGVDTVAATAAGVTAVWRVARHAVIAGEPVTVRRAASGGEPATARPVATGGEPVTVYLAETAPGIDRVAATAALQTALAAAGESSPQVEVFGPGERLPAYHEAALAKADLVWTAMPVAGSRVFDGANPRQGPYFVTDHERLAGERRERLLDYLRGGDVVFDVDGEPDDVLAGRRRQRASAPLGRLDRRRARATLTAGPDAGPEQLWRAG
jgi:hypothetical protein